MGNLTVMEYIDKFREYSLCCIDMSTVEAKFVFKTNTKNWVTLYVLPYNCPNLP